MSQLLTSFQSIAKGRWVKLDMLLVCLSLALCLVGVLDFSKLQTFGLFLLPLILRLRNSVPRKRSIYGGLAVFFLIIHIVFGQEYWLFATGLSTLFFLIEKRVGRLDAAAFYALIFYLPFTSGFFRVFGFYIRMYLTELAAKTCAFFSPSVTRAGNQLMVMGQEYTVDAGCMGLRLVVTAFILTLVINQVFSRSNGLTLNRWYFMAVVKLSFVLVVLANYFRILVLIWAQSPEGSTSHEVIGIVCFVLFHIIPMIFISRWAINRFGKKAERAIERNYRKIKTPFTLALVPILLFGLVWGVGVQHDNLDDIVISIPSGYELVETKKQVSSFENGQGSVIHVKAVSPMSFSNHHPLVCWRGDGFSSGKEMKINMGEIAGFSACLDKGSKHLETMWWYSDLKGNEFDDEWTWRVSSVLNRKQMFLVNYSHIDHNQLVYEVNRTKDELGVMKRIVARDFSQNLQ